MTCQADGPFPVALAGATGSLPLIRQRPVGVEDNSAGRAGHTKHRQVPGLPQPCPIPLRTVHERGPRSPFRHRRFVSAPVACLSRTERRCKAHANLAELRGKWSQSWISTLVVLENPTTLPKLFRRRHRAKSVVRSLPRSSWGRFLERLAVNAEIRGSKPAV